MFFDSIIKGFYGYHRNLMTHKGIINDKKINITSRHYIIHFMIRYGDKNQTLTIVNRFFLFIMIIRVPILFRIFQYV